MLGTHHHLLLLQPLLSRLKTRPAAGTPYTTVYSLLHLISGRRRHLRRIMTASATLGPSSGGSRGWCRRLWWRTWRCSLSPCMKTIALSIPFLILALQSFWADSPFNPSKRTLSLVLLLPREFSSRLFSLASTIYLLPLEKEKNTMQLHKK